MLITQALFFGCIVSQLRILQFPFLYKDSHNSLIYQTLPVFRSSFFCAYLKSYHLKLLWFYHWAAQLWQHLTLLFSLLCVFRSWRKPCQCRTWTSLETSLLVCCKDVTSVMILRKYIPKKLVYWQLLLKVMAMQLNAFLFYSIHNRWMRF